MVLTSQKQTGPRRRGRALHHRVNPSDAGNDNPKTEAAAHDELTSAQTTAQARRDKGLRSRSFRGDKGSKVVVRIKERASHHTDVGKYGRDGGLRVHVRDDIHVRKVVESD